MMIRCSHAQLTPSGEVLVCPDAVLEMTCNVTEQGFLQWRVMSQQIQPPVPYFIWASLFNSSMLGVPLPQSSRAPGITVTPHIVSSALISATMTVDTANYDLRTLGPLEVTCAGEHAAIRELGNKTLLPPKVDLMLVCILLIEVSLCTCYAMLSAFCVCPSYQLHNLLISSLCSF